LPCASERITVSATFEVQNRIGDAHAAASDGSIFERRNPADHDDLVSVAPESSADDVGAAVAAARDALAAWRRTTPTVRADLLTKASRILAERAPNLEVEGEMHGDTALSDEIRQRVFPHSRMRGEANLLVMPTLDAANISFNLLKVASSDNVTIGPILLGAARPVHILTPSATVRRIINMTALAVADANALR
jgi:hypothetical protein